MYIETEGLDNSTVSLMKMKMRIFLVIILFVTNLAAANANELSLTEQVQFSKGYSAFKSGMYDKALDYWLPLAQAGYVDVEMSVTSAYEEKGVLLYDLKREK